MILAFPTREYLAFHICQGMWGHVLAEHYRRNGSDVRWHDALRAADHLIRFYGVPDQPPPARIFPDGDRHGFLKPADLRSGNNGPSVRYPTEGGN